MPPKHHCRYCQCTDTHRCSGGCVWANHQHTLCTACRAIDAAFQRATREIAAAFFRGWACGAGDVERQIDNQKNPFAPFTPPGSPGYWWEKGFACGAVYGKDDLEQRRAAQGAYQSGRLERLTHSASRDYSRRHKSKRRERRPNVHNR